DFGEGVGDGPAAVRERRRHLAGEAQGGVVVEGVLLLPGGLGCVVLAVVGLVFPGAVGAVVADAVLDGPSVAARVLDLDGERPPVVVAFGQAGDDVAGRLHGRLGLVGHRVLLGVVGCYSRVRCAVAHRTGPPVR